MHLWSEQKDCQCAHVQLDMFISLESQLLVLRYTDKLINMVINIY